MSTGQFPWLRVSLVEHFVNPAGDERGMRSRVIAPGLFASCTSAE